MRDAQSVSGAEKSKMRGRGRLCSLDMLPQQAKEDVAWSEAQLLARKLPQTAILTELNSRLSAKGLSPISRAAFNRFAKRQLADVQASKGGPLAAMLKPFPADSASRSASIELARATLIALLFADDLHDDLIEDVSAMLVAMVRASAEAKAAVQ